MAKTVACVIARTVSTRLPLKVLRTVTPELSMIDFILQRLKRAERIDEIYLCTSHEPVDDILEDVAEKNGVKVYRGSTDAVIERIIDVGDQSSADHVIRITGDNVFTATELLDQQIATHERENLDYTRIVGLPVGATAEVMALSAVKDCYGRIDPAVSEYLLLYMFDPDRYQCGVLQVRDQDDFSSLSLTVDTPADLTRTREILAKFNADPIQMTLKDILKIVHGNDIENTSIPDSAEVKLPYGKTVSFADFKADMALRASKSKQLKLIG